MEQSIALFFQFEYFASQKIKGEGSRCEKHHVMIVPSCWATNGDTVVCCYPALGLENKHVWDLAQALKGWFPWMGVQCLALAAPCEQGMG